MVFYVLRRYLESSIISMNWRRIVGDFLDKEWRNREWYAWAIICWSYVTGNPSIHSDIDLHIILNEKCDWRERWNRVIDGLMIEYFANPPQQHKQYFEDDHKKRRKLNAHMFVTWEVVEDSLWLIEILVGRAETWMIKPFEKTHGLLLEIQQYALRDELDNLKEMCEADDIWFHYAYFSLLQSVYTLYSGYYGFPTIQPNKLHRFLVNETDQKKYRIPLFPDSNFVSLFNAALVWKSKEVNMKVWCNIVDYTLRATWWFEVDGWTLNSPLDI